MRVGFIGLGDQGGPMAEMILKSGFPLAVWARRQGPLQHFSTLGATVAANPAALAAMSDLLCLCVTGDADVRQLLFNSGIIGAMNKQAALAIHSTIRPETCIEVARVAAARGISFLDMPVSGSGHAARARKLLVMAGGPGGAIAQAMPVLESYAGTIIRIGDVGSAMRAKLINNLLAVVNIGQAYRAFSLGREIGLDPGALRGALLAGTARTFALELMERLQNPERASHVLAIVSKDIALAMESLPADRKAYWDPLARIGLEALRELKSGAIVLPSGSDDLGEYVIN